MAAGVDVVNDDDGGEVLEWKAFDGSFVRADAVLLIYRAQNGEIKRLKTPASGVVTLDPAVKTGKVMQSSSLSPSFSVLSQKSRLFKIFLHVTIREVMRQVVEE
ncbi:unnamed protein product [Toxocara canis]|uniref:Uncharacterized protein n=1 Tax=Toxocara canis TaxID=6265 RepID=A0A183U4U0_TOXCA|nr:unnamed protein product [Toxocara canis]